MITRDDSFHRQLSALVSTHRDRHHVHYGADLLTDHGPMASLALAGLGAPFETIGVHARRYERRLERRHETNRAIDSSNYHNAVGRIEAYSALLDFFDHEIATHGRDPTLHRYLPDLISGWVHDAYHATIRLGYGIEFDIASEVAAGLAYLAAVGPDPALLVQAETRRNAADPLAAARALYHPTFGMGDFATRYRTVVRGGVVNRCMPDPTDTLRRASRAALGVFDSTHGFFALHLVTGSHAMRVCMPFAGPTAEALLWAGVVAGYLCIGAPQAGSAVLSSPLDVAPDFAIRDPEHLIKLAFTARSQSQAFDDAAYLAVVERYLAGTDPIPRV